MAHNDSAARYVDVGVSAKSLAGIRGVAASMRRHPSPFCHTPSQVEADRGL